MTTTTLRDKTIVMSGGSRGIGLALARRAAADGANIVLIAKTDTPHPALTGTIHTAAAEIEAAGGRALPIVGDIRSDDVITRAVDAAVREFGGIDACVNNASVLNVASTLAMEPRRYDLMMDVGVRGTFQLSRACLPWLLKSSSPHILSMSPPLNLSSRWLGAHPGYMVAKYSMTLATLGIGAEHRSMGLIATCLWPRTLVSTDAIANVLADQESLRHTRRPEIMADAAYALLVGAAPTPGGETLLDEDVLARAGITDLEHYAVQPLQPLTADLFVDA